jgi:hypothetical protein
MNNPNELAHIVDTSGLEEQTAITLKDRFLPFYEQVQGWKNKAEQLVVTDVSQTAEMKMAREARLALREIRISADKMRKELKEDSLRYGKAVQGVYNLIEYMIVPIEKHLEQQEKFKEIQDAKRKEQLRQQRMQTLEPYREFVPVYIDLANMTDEDFDKTLNGAILLFKDKQEAEKRVEEQRLAKEKAEAEERERIKLENQRLKAEQEAMQQKMAEERAKLEEERRELEKKAEIEKQEIAAALREKAKLEAEIRAKQEAEEKALAAERKAKRDAEKAPDKEKLAAFAKTIENIELPNVKDEDALQIVLDAKSLLIKVVNYINDKTQKL